MREWIEQHGGVIALVLGVIVVWFLAARKNTPNVIQTGGPQPLDPNAAAIEQARLTSNAQNVQTLAQLIGLEEQTSAAAQLQQYTAQLQSEIKKAEIEASARAAEQQANAAVRVAQSQAGASKTASITNGAVQLGVAIISYLSGRGPSSGSSGPSYGPSGPSFRPGGSPQPIYANNGAYVVGPDGTPLMGVPTSAPSWYHSGMAPGYYALPGLPTQSYLYV